MPPTATVQPAEGGGQRPGRAQRNSKPTRTEVDSPVMDQGTRQAACAARGFLILRQAFSEALVEARLEAVECLIDIGLAGKCEMRWIDRERRLPETHCHLLDPEGTTLLSGTGSTRISGPI